MHTQGKNTSVDIPTGYNGNCFDFFVNLLEIEESSSMMCSVKVTDSQ